MKQEAPELQPLSPEEAIQRVTHVLCLLESIEGHDSPLPKVRVLLRGIIGCGIATTAEAGSRVSATGVAPEVDESHLDRIQKALDDASEERYQSLREWEQLSNKWKSEGDMYGWNFHQGMMAGANYVDIYYHRVAREIKAIRESAPAPVEQSEPWRDEGGHAWERRAKVECVECPHCLFTFDASHTDGDSAGYSCPNCEGCPEAPASPAAPVLHCSCGAACTPDEYAAHRAMGHDAGLPKFRNTKEAMLYAQQQNIPTVVPVTASPSTLAKAAAEALTPHIDPYFRLNRDWQDQIAAIIERCLAGGGEDQKSTPTGL